MAVNEDQRIGRLLVREGAITEEDLSKALEAQEASYGKPLGEVMIELQMIDEPDFLRVLAKKFHTQYLTTKKLSEIKVSEGILKLVPQATAEKYNLFPVQFKRGDKTLTVIMTNPDDVAAIDEVKFVSGIATVKPLVGLSESINAAIKKWYQGDDNAFGMLERFSESFDGDDSPRNAPAAHLESADGPLDLTGLVRGKDDEEGEADVSEKPDDQKVEVDFDDDDSEVDEDEEPSIRDVILGGGGDGGVYLGGMEEVSGDMVQDEASIVIEDLPGDEPVEEVTLEPVSRQSSADDTIDPKSGRRGDVKKYRMRMLVVEPHDSIRKFIIRLFGHEGFRVRGVDGREQALAELAKDEYDSLVIKDRDLGEGDEFVNLIAEKYPEVELCSIKDYGSAVIGETRSHKKLMNAFIETLDVLMGLLEMESGAMQGHSHNAGKYCKLIAGKLGLPQREVDTISIAAYVHELGKKGMKHRSILKIDDSVDMDDVVEQAEIPLKLLSAAKIPLEIKIILRHQFERWDGQGAPGGLSGLDIPIGSRVLALVEAFEDLTNGGFAGDPRLEPPAALESLKKHENAIFDPELVEIFMSVVRDDIYLQEMAGAAEKILIVDTEVDQLTLLDLRLVNMGFLVSNAGSGEEGLAKAKEESPSLILTEAVLPDMSGFDMIEKLQSDSATRDIPFIFLSKKDDAASVNKGFQLGAMDYITKPIKVDILGAKINTMMSRLSAQKKSTASTSGGVSGTLSEMGLPDIVQILSAGRKTGRITLENNGETCYIDMENGQVVNASVDDLKGEEAFYKILYWNEGSFSIDPSVEITERLITLTSESLMLEGFRRMDEEMDGKGGDDIQLDGSDFF